MDARQIREILKVGAILCAITAVSAGTLAAVNKATAPIIAENAEKKQNEAMRAVLPEAENFERREFFEDGSSVTAVYDGGVGYAVLCEPRGYGGNISLVVGIDADNRVSAVDITAQSETPGLGARCIEEEFKAQFVGKTGEITVTKRGGGEDEVDAISSATITSRAVTAGVNDALRAVRIIGGTEGENEKE